VAKLTLLCVIASIAMFSKPRQTQKPSFDVASVKPNLSGNGFMDTTPGRFIATGVPLRMLLREAYSLMDAQIVGGAGWINSDRWDVEGKVNADNQETSHTREMVQSLIEDRFQLKFHHETRDLPVYELTVANGGTKMKLSANPNPPRGRMGRGNIEGTGWSVSNLIKFLSQTLDRPIVDKTNLKGLYDITLQWSPELGPAASPDQPGVFTAIQEQLGLKLQAIKGPVEVFVIDSVLKPTEN